MGGGLTSHQTWCRVGASVAGTSHEVEGRPCEDAAISIERHGKDGPVLISVASDGAGSSPMAKIGARLVVRGFASVASDYVKSGISLRNISEELIKSWIDGV